MCKARTMLLMACVMLAIVLRLSETAASPNKDTAIIISLHASAKSPTTVEVRWAVPKMSTIQHWIVTVSTTKDQRNLVSYIKVPSERKNILVDGLISNTTYYVFFNALRRPPHSDFIAFLSDPVKVTTRGREDSREESASLRSVRQAKTGESNDSVPTVPTTLSAEAETSTTSNQVATMTSAQRSSVPTPHASLERSSESQYDGSLGRKVAEEQRKGMVRYVLICMGAGFGLICILSLLTLATYRPWRQPRGVSMRKKSSPGGRATNTDDTPGEASKQDPSVSGSSVPSSTVPDLLPRPRPHRAADSVVSWGSEFDILEGPEENIYNNNNPTSPQPSSSNASSLQQQSLPPPRVPPRRSAGVQHMFSKFRDNLSTRWANRHSGFSSNTGSGFGSSRGNLKTSGDVSSLQQGDHSADGGYISGSSTYDNNCATLDSRTVDDDSVYINTEFASRGVEADDDLYVNSDLAVARH